MFRRYDDDESPVALCLFLVSALVLHVFIFKRGVGGLFWGGCGGGRGLCYLTPQSWVVAKFLGLCVNQQPVQALDTRCVCGTLSQPAA